MSFVLSASNLYNLPLIPSYQHHNKFDNTVKMDVEPPASDTDSQLKALLESIKSYDEAALAELYDLTVERVYSLAMVMTGNASDAEEVVGDVYLKVWQRATQYQAERGKVMTWLLVTCRSQALDLLRQRQRRQQREQSQQDLPEVVVEDAALSEQPITAETLLNSLQEGQQLHQALSQLSAVQQQMIGLAFFQDMSHNAIASTLDMPLGTVKSHIRRGLQILRQHIDIG